MRYFLPSAKHVFQRLCALSPKQAEMLGDFLSSSHDGKDDLRKLAIDFEMSDDSVDELVHYGTFLRSNSDQDSVDLSQINIDLTHLKKEFSIDIQDTGSAATTLLRVLRKPPTFLAESKRRRIQSGLQSTIDDVSSLVELRPIFDKDRETISAWVIGGTLRIDYEAPNGDSNVLLLAIEEKSLGKLRDAIKLIDKKLKKIEEKGKELRIL